MTKDEKDGWVQSLPQQEFLKYCAARFVWKRRAVTYVDKNGKDRTWKNWWDEKYKDDLNLYVDSMIASQKTWKGKGSS